MSDKLSPRLPLTLELPEFRRLAMTQICGTDHSEWPINFWPPRNMVLVMGKKTTLVSQHLVQSINLPILCKLIPALRASRGAGFIN